MSRSANNITPESAGRPFQYGLRWLFFWPLIFAVVVGTDGFGLIGFRYPHAVENEPLKHPVRIVSQRGDRWTLADGRSIDVSSFRDPQELTDRLRYSEMLVDVDAYDERADGLLEIYVKSRQFVCGVPWCRLINIPLIPDAVPKNRRESIGCGRIVATEDVAVRTNPSEVSSTP
jgi:hypothetical protein